MTPGKESPMQQSTSESPRDCDAEVIAHFVALIHARRRGDYLAAADAHCELARRGVRLRLTKATAAQAGEGRAAR